MTVYQRTYQGYRGAYSPALSRPLVLTRYAIKDVFTSRLFSIFFAACLIPPLVAMVVIYMRYNLELMSALGLSAGDLLTIDGRFFARAQLVQAAIAFALINIVGPALISPDLRNQALPLFLSRPIDRWEYITGKLLVLVGLASLVTWAPGALLYLFQAYLAGGEWLSANAVVLPAMISSTLIWIVSLSMLALAVSAWVKWKPIARLAFLIVIFVTAAMGTAIREIFGGVGGSLLNVFETFEALSKHLYGIPTTIGLALPESLAMFLTLAVVSAAVLVRRLRAFEVVG